ncbi:phosphoribosylformylglycinamidine cyclo-ligase [Thermotoga sp. KOL6]|uniref:phosphoribosylformylglycinamidine cyclo-ligase n=1 Tax=Thermotoga sp. KOL6 TaxID=126741 RepID=UPI000C791550|nr:phosphoribosylformylglycinamidine cyclo-ligase [Thermotoga sp. KOL6]PLV59966.1 phosphoribosylaminoimidazole synthetase [Thermotoga sp. KOL6]
MKYTYKNAGVDVERGEKFSKKIKETVNLPDWLLKEPTGYAAVLGISKPPVAVTADGIGTKLILHRKYGTWRYAAEDLVGMNYNDLVCVGARPLAFLDYLGVEKISEEHEKFIEELISVLESVGMKLVGGETAEMPDVYRNDWDAVGFAVGILERNIPIDTIKEGDIIIGIPSSGFHSNGWSLIRKILKEENIKPESLPFDLLKGTRIYSEVIDVFDSIKGLAHVTGGGVYRALKRVLRNSGAHISLPRRDFIDWILRYVEFEEAINTFNMGIGMFVIAEKDKLENILSRLESGIVVGKVDCDWRIEYSS